MIHPFGRRIRIALWAAMAGGLVVAAAMPASADFYAGVLAAQAEDYETALKEWLPLAEEGLAGAQSGIGDLYAKGLGVEEDSAAAARWHLLAADQGVLRSIFFIGTAFAGGNGVEKDIPEAVKWLTLSKNGGHPNAAEVLSLIAQQITDEDAAEGQRRADAWTPKPPN